MYPVIHKYTHADHHDVPHAKLHSGAKAFPASENPCGGGYSPGLSERHQHYCAPERCMGRIGSGLQFGVPKSTPQQHRVSEDAVETTEGGMSCSAAEETGTAGSWASCVCPHSGKLKYFLRFCNSVLCFGTSSRRCLVWLCVFLSGAERSYCPGAKPDLLSGGGRWRWQLCLS